MIEPLPDLENDSKLYAWAKVLLPGKKRRWANISPTLVRRIVFAVVYIQLEVIIGALILVDVL